MQLTGPSEAWGRWFRLPVVASVVDLPRSRPSLCPLAEISGSFPVGPWVYTPSQWPVLWGGGRGGGGQTN